MKKTVLFLFLIVLFPATSFAFCGFFAGSAGKDLYSDATSVIMMRDGTTTTLSMQNEYAGPAKNFTMVIPVPQVLEKKDVKTLTHEIFEKVDKLSAPRLVEYVERDPCAKPVKSKFYDFDDMPIDGTLKPPVVVKARFNVDEYKIVILSAKDSTSLESWLKKNKYGLSKKAAKYLQPYIQSGMYFFAAKVDMKKVKKIDGKYRLSPIRFTYESDDFTLPIRLGLINSRGTQDLLVHILADKQRYEVGNYPSVSIPTNLELKATTKSNFGVFYRSLFDAVLKATPNAVVTEYAWNAGNCDPCPGDALTSSDLLILGGDRINGKKGNANFRGFVLTRLHTRYKAGNVGKDLVFQAAKPIIGGGVHDKKGVKSSKYNRFQGRYIIRKRWKKNVTCGEPKYESWEVKKPTKASKAQSSVREKKNVYRDFSKTRIKLRNSLKRLENSK